MDNFDDTTPVTIPDGTNLPFDGDLEELVVDDQTPTSRLAAESRCPRCETGVDGRGLIRITDRAPQPDKEQALRLTDCVATQAEPEGGGWRWCANQKFMRGLHDVYWGPERRCARLPPPGGVDRRVIPPREDDR